MILKLKEKKESSAGYNLSIYDNSALKVIMFASLIIVLSVVLMGIISYVITNNAIVDKLKTKDLVYIARSISSKIEGRVERATETSMMLARDPSVMDWIMNSEKDEVLGNFAKEKITDIAKTFDYSNSFIVSAVTNHYWAEGGRLIDTMSKSDQDDSWFFETIASKQPISIVIDHNNERGDTFVFVNALMGDIEKPIAITGVGLSLQEISKEFEGYKFGQRSNMWLIDKRGIIYISEDVGQTGISIADFIPADISKSIIDDAENRNPNVIEYKNTLNETYDLIYQPIRSTDWKLVLQIPRSESISIVNSIRVNTVAASIVTIILIVLIFYLISNRIANPYRRALILSRELERQVDERTQELKEKNEKIMDSIEYAKMIQESILPPPDELGKVFKEHFVLYRPRDIVGGDFYWLKRVGSGYILAVGDCTGHGVPGALMTMAVNSALNYIANEICQDNPALILKEMDRFLKQTLNKENSDSNMDHGLDIGVVYVSKSSIMFAGAKMNLYLKDSHGLSMLKGDSRNIGYKGLDDMYEFTNHILNIDGEETFYITTDGYPDQNGGDKDYAFGRRRFEEMLNKIYSIGLPSQVELIERELKEYMRGEPQRDDILVIGFKPFA